MQDHRSKPLRSWVNGEQKAQCRTTGQQEQDFLLGSAETPKSGPAEKANSTPSRTVHTSNEQIPLSRAGVLVLAGAILLWLSTISLYPSNNCKLRLISSLLQCLPSGPQGNTARFAPWETASATTVWRWWKADGTSTLHMEQAAPLAFSRGTVLLPGCIFNPLQPFGPWEHRGKKKRATGILKHEKKLQNLLSVYFDWVLCLLAPAFILVFNFCACQGYRGLLLEVSLEAELPKVQTDPMPKQHSIHSFTARWCELHKKSEKKNPSIFESHIQSSDSFVLVKLAAFTSRRDEKRPISKHYHFNTFCDFRSVHTHCLVCLWGRNATSSRESTRLPSV